ncbi:hypothetical protein [Sediminimonas sp.]|jgi:hypothetical protein|uniref:hypothetical protein n=1 Tax=Sediminimonas sp. TaxID=2823379 RepID=UPI0025F2FCBD|nr:hypothetical protein [Sediminimonas sp.]
MRRPITLFVVAALTLSACGTVRESRLNPFNWFGQSRSESVERVQETNPLIPQRAARKQRRDAPVPGPLIARVTDMTVDRVPGGAVIKAEGLAASAGAFDVVLVARDNADAAKLSYEMRARLPARAPRGGPETGRRVVAAASVTDQKLQGIRTIEVIGQDNLRSVRR